jgi:hypothetical protein
MSPSADKTAPVLSYHGPEDLRPSRVVSLVPSLTHTVACLGRVDRLAGRTDYCCHPAEELAEIPAVGGTKNPDLNALLALEPDLVLLDRDENRRETALALEDKGLNTLTVNPHRAADVPAVIEFLADLLAARPAAQTMCDTLRNELARRAAHPADPLPTVCLLWMKPYMSCNGQTYVSDMMRIAGFQNILGGHPRRYFDLAAAESAGRYPRLAVVLLPSEPYAFSTEDIPAVSHELDVSPDRIRLVTGEHLTWYGAMTIPALASLARLRKDIPDSTGMI